MLPLQKKQIIGGMSLFISYKYKERTVVGPDGKKQKVKSKYYGLFVSYTRYKGDRPHNCMHTGIGYLDEEFTMAQREALKVVLMDMVTKSTFPFSTDAKVDAKAEEIFRRYLEKSGNTPPVPIDKETEDERMKRILEDYKKKQAFEDDIALKVKTMRVFDSRSVGAEVIGLEIMRQLGLQKFLQKDCGFNELDSKVAICQIVARAIYPYSELRTADILQTESSLCELLGIDQGIMNKDRLYRMAKRLSALRDRIEIFLRNKVTVSLFDQEGDKLIIMDCTNTFFEGRMEHSEICQYGRSKEKRYDCKLVGIALVINSQGFIVRSKIIRGNIQDVTVLKSVISELGFNIQNGEKRIVVLDCGFASVSNLKFLKENGYDYVTVMRSGVNKSYDPIGEPVMQETDNGKQSIRLQKVAVQYPAPRQTEWESVQVDGDTFLIDIKSRKVVSLQNKLKRLVDKLERFSAGIQGRGTKQKDKLMKKLFKLEQDNPEFYKCFNIRVTYNAEDIATSLTFDYDEGMADSIIIEKADKYTPEEAEAYDEEHVVLEDNVLLVDSYTKELKEQSMLDLELERFERSLEAMAKTIGSTRPIKSEKKFHQSLGALMERYPHGSKCYRIAYEFEEGHLKSLTYELNEEEKNKAYGKHGKYLIRTSLEDLDETICWMYYNVIRTVEESFKICKSDLNLRPNYHKLDEGIIAHIDLSLMAYWLVSVVNYRLKTDGYRVRWDRLSAAAKGLQRVSVVGKTHKKERNVKVRLNEECPKFLIPIFETLGVHYDSDMKTQFLVEPVDNQNLYDPLFARDTVP